MELEPLEALAVVTCTSSALPVAPDHVVQFAFFSIKLPSVYDSKSSEKLNCASAVDTVKEKRINSKLHDFMVFYESMNFWLLIDTKR